MSRGSPVIAAFDEDEVSDDELEEYPRDPAIDEAKPFLLEYFKTHRDDIYYLTQLQVIFEKRFFHWITAKAINELISYQNLQAEVRLLHEAPSQKGPKVKFVFHPSLRYVKRTIERKLNLIRCFSDENVARAAGKHAESLFSRAFLLKGFKQVATNTNEYGGSTWTETGHNLDFIFERDDIVYGCEIKNRFEYIDRPEMRLKLRMCKHLGLTPLFIMRSAPKSYIYEIQQNAGFAKIYDWHIYPYGFEKLTKEIRTEFRDMPAYCVDELPDTILHAFLRWHERHIPKST